MSSSRPVARAAARAASTSSRLRTRWVDAPVASTRIAFTPANTPQARYNPAIEAAARRGKLFKAIQLAAELKRACAASGTRPDLASYEALARAFAWHGLHVHASRLIDDARAIGLEPDIGVWNQVLRAHIEAGAPLAEVLSELQRERVAPNSATLAMLVDHCVEQKNLEGALWLVLVQGPLDGKDDGLEAAASALGEDALLFKLPLESVSKLCLLAAGCDELALSVDILRLYEKQTSRRLPEGVVIRILRQSVHADEADSAKYTFERVASTTCDLDEGLLLSALALFSRHGMLEQCHRIIDDVLPRILHGPLQSYHYAPLIAAHMRAIDFDGAMEAYKRMSAARLQSAPGGSSRNIVFAEGLQTAEVAREAAKAVIARLDKFPSVAAGSEALPPSISMPAIVGVLSACNRLGLAEEAAAVADKVLQPHLRQHLPLRITFFNVLFEGCLPPIAGRIYPEPGQHGRPSDVQRAESLLEILRSPAYSGSVKPDRTTYELLIDIYLYSNTEGATWEMAFDYLEEMKHYDILPAVTVYSGLLHRVLSEEEKERGGPGEIPIPLVDESSVAGEHGEASSRSWRQVEMLLQEMAALGYLGGRTQTGTTRSMLSRHLRERIGLRRIDRVLEQYYAGRRGVAERTDPLWRDTQTGQVRRNLDDSRA